MRKQWSEDSEALWSPDEAVAAGPHVLLYLGHREHLGTAGGESGGAVWGLCQGGDRFCTDIPGRSPGSCTCEEAPAIQGSEDIGRGSGGGAAFCVRICVCMYIVEVVLPALAAPPTGKCP